MFAKFLNLSKFKQLGVAFLAMLFVFGGYVVWNNYFSTAAKFSRAEKEKYDKFINYQLEFEEALKNDTYGGKTPQETLDLFVDALKKGDMELAAQYFEFETNENDPNYLTVRGWEENLKDAQEKNRINELINYVATAKPVGGFDKNSFGFEVKNDEKNLLGNIGTHFNSRSGVWKITSL